jgi:hypothetical protein
MNHDGRGQKEMTFFLPHVYCDLWMMVTALADFSHVVWVVGVCMYVLHM